MMMMMMMMMMMIVRIMIMVLLMMVLLSFGSKVRMQKNKGTDGYDDGGGGLDSTIVLPGILDLLSRVLKRFIEKQPILVFEPATSMYQVCVLPILLRKRPLVTNV